MQGRLDLERTPGYYILTPDSAEYTESETNPEVKTTDSMSFYDPRHRTLGGRIICPADSLEVELESFTLNDNPNEYHILRTLYGIPEVINNNYRVQRKFMINYH